MTARPIFRFGIPLLALVSVSLVTVAQQGLPPGSRPGSLGGGVTLLPNGWRIAPAGRHMAIGDLPLNMLLSPDGRYLIVTNNGYAKPTLRVVDLERMYIASTLPLDDAWLGLAWHPNGQRLYSSGAASNSIVEIGVDGGKLARHATLWLARRAETPTQGTNRPDPTPQSFVGGVAVSPDGRSIAAVHVLGQVVSLVDTTTGLVRATADLPAEPYTTIFSRDGTTLFVSLWGGATVLRLDAKTLALQGEIAVGEHPNAMVEAPDGRLFVACANTNAVWVVDPKADKAVEQVSIALFPNAPPGSTPNSVALSPDAKTLVVANADNNTVAVVDVATDGWSQVKGFIPTGWYPTGALFSKDGGALYILSGKGLSSLPNPHGSQPGISGADGQYSGSMLQGTLSIVPTPDDATLQKYTRTVYEVTPYSDATRLAPASAPAQSPIPRVVGGPSPIKHVFYIIRENRTYDQILGDLGTGNGDPNLTLFGEDVTPNAHALAREFVTLDNFYVDAEVSYDGHAFSTGAIATDFVEKIWPTNYGSRGGVYLSEGGGKMRNAYGNITAPLHGYLWDACLRAGKTVRSYGEFAERDRSTGRVVASVPGLEGRVHPNYEPWNLKVPDNERVDVWLEEFRQFEANGQLPALSIFRLGNDHTNGTRVGSPTPRAMIAENDQALGRIVEAVSHSRYWNESAIFVLEDDAQNGPDHVDAHRSVALVASPYVRRAALDSTLYTTSGMLRTMELVLGLEPMTQYDAAATPMYRAFTAAPTASPFTRRQARVSLTELNAPGAFGALASARMDLEQADMAPEFELNEILWKSVRGRDSVMPPPKRTGFVWTVRPGPGDEDDR
jgi:YVTN family beta-propeller protein